jgi:hypothetical protein
MALVLLTLAISLAAMTTVSRSHPARS